VVAIAVSVDIAKTVKEVILALQPLEIWRMSI
jgi:hypothetical protein